MATNLNVSDVWTCYKAFRREVLQALDLREDPFGFEQEVTIKTARGDWRVYEVPISYYGRTYAEGKNDQVGILADYGRISRVEPIALRLLDVYSVQSCLLERNEALGTLLAASPQWQKVYADDRSVLFVRRGHS
jgi:hypothetical protein